MRKLLKCKEHKEIFIIEDGKKCWIANPETYLYLGYKWGQAEVIPFERLRDDYPVGPTKIKKTVTAIVEGEKPRDIFYPEESENPYSWIRGLLTLNPKPSKQLAFDLGFNLIAPYASLPSNWVNSGGKVVFTTKTVRDNEVGIIAYSTCDEPDCHKHNPFSELELVEKMKKQTKLPVGTTLVGDIGCGIQGTASSKEEYKKQWIEVLNQMDLVLIDIYPYKKPEYIGGRTPLEEMEYRHQFFMENVTVPIIIIIQAHQSKSYQIKPNPMEQVKFWVDRGYGYIVYPWDDGGSPIGGVADMQDEWRKANEYGIPCIPCGDKEEMR